MKKWFMKQPDARQQRLKSAMWLTSGASFLWIRLLPSGFLIDLLGYVCLASLVLAILFGSWQKASRRGRDEDRAKAQPVTTHDSPLFSSEGGKPRVETSDVPTHEVGVKDAAFQEEDGFSKGADDSANAQK